MDGGKLSSSIVVAFLVVAAIPAYAQGAEFGFTGQEQSYVVPPGVTSVSVDARGAAGDGLSGGSGAQVQASVEVVPGQVLFIEVGGVGVCNGAGRAGQSAASSDYGGGGAADIRTVSVADAGGSLCGSQSNASLGARLIVAGGGGGSSGASFNPGGDAGAPGGGAGGGAGTATAGGVGGAPGGTDGTLGFGGVGTSCCPFYSGGGGGGGFYGGGSGGYSNDPAAVGGGGGGSSLVPAGGSLGLADGPAAITITPERSLGLATTGDGSGFVTSEPAGIDCQTGSSAHRHCEKTVQEGSTITLTAVADAGSSFAAWSGGGCSGSPATCTVTMDSARSVEAQFTKDPPPPSEPDPPPPSDEPPVITGMKVVPNSFVADPRPMQPRQPGAAIELSLSEPASVLFRVRRDPIRKSSKPGSGARVLIRSLPEGASSVPFGSTFRKRLKPGRYQVIARATDSAGQRSERARAKFRVTG